MNKLISNLLGWFGWGGAALGARSGQQSGSPSGSAVEGTTSIAPDGALQISTVWACVEILASTIASLPLFVYSTVGGNRELARTALAWQILHDSPNSRMTPFEFWTAMILNLLLRGNAYARIERSANGEAIALWPMPSDQVELRILPDGSSIYLYRLDNDVAALDASNVLHIKGLGNGIIGLNRLEYMRATTSEAINTQHSANKLFANGGKPTGVLMIDRVLDAKQRAAILENFSDLAVGSTSRLRILEANMKYQQVNLSPADQQILETRRFTVEEICRWFGVPSVLVNHSNVTAWGSGIEQLIEGFYKFTIRPALVNIEQAISKRVFTSSQRVRYSVEWNFDALLRASLEKRAEIYSKLVQNGIKTRNECRQLENDPPSSQAGANDLTVQSNLLPLHKLGQQQRPGALNAAA